MSIQGEITRIQTARNKLRTKAVELGIAQSTARIDTLATAFDTIQNQGAVSATVQEGDTYTIPKGYHNGSGTVSGVSGGGSYMLQSKTITPTKQQQNVTPDSGYYGLSDVTVSAIPENFQDVSSVTASEEDVLATKVFVTSDGSVKAGIMVNNGAVSKVLDTTSASYTVPKGYHSGTGTVSVVMEEKEAIPNKTSQEIIATSGKVISKVTVSPIPDEYQDITGVTATAEHVLSGDIFVNTSGENITGTMVNNGSISGSFDGLSTNSYVIPKGYHDGTGTVSLTNDIETSLAGI